MPSVAIIGTRGYPSYYGGFETAVRQLAPFLAEAGWDVLVYGRDGSTVDEDPSRDPRVRTRKTHGLESKSLSTLSYGLTSCLDAAIRKPDVALVMNVANGFWLPILKARGVPILTNVDGIEWDRDKWGRAAKWMFRTGAKLTARYSNGLVYDARAIASRWKRDFNRDGFFIPYGGTLPQEIGEVEHGLTRRGYVLIVARFVPENTIPEFFEAVEEIAGLHQVVIVGSSGYAGELDRRAAELADTYENVQWLGHVKDDARLHSLWHHAGAYFHGHSVGGTNPALVQAMAMGAPTVARATEFNREVLGDAGVYVQSSPQSIAAGVLSLLRNPSKQDSLALAAQARASEHYTWELVCSAYERALSKHVGLKDKPRWKA